MTYLIRLYYTLPNEPCSFTCQRGYTHGIGHNGANAMTKLLTFHSSVLSDRLISDQESYIAHLFYIAQELKKKVAQYRPVITVHYRHTKFNFLHTSGFMRVKITYNNIFVQFESQHMPMFYIYCSFLLQIILFQGEIKRLKQHSK